MEEIWKDIEGFEGYYQPKKRRLTPEQRQAALREWFKED